jgi:hypothetical protein
VESDLGVIDVRIGLQDYETILQSRNIGDRRRFSLGFAAMVH